MCLSVSALQPLPIPCHAVSVRTVSRFHLGGLPNGRPRRYVQCTSGSLEHYSQDSAATLDHMQRMRRPSSFPKQRQDQTQRQWPKARCMANLQMNGLRQDMESVDLRKTEC